MHLFIKQQPTPTLFVEKSVAPDLFLGEAQLPSLYLAKAKNPDREAMSNTFKIAERVGATGVQGVERKGYTIGNYATHREKGTSQWTVTHIPSGMSISHADRKANAVGQIEFLHRAARDAGKDIEFGNPTTEDARSEGMQTIREATSVWKYGKEKPSYEQMKAAHFKDLTEARESWINELFASRNKKMEASSAAARPGRLATAQKEWHRMNEADNEGSPHGQLTAAMEKDFKNRWSDVADEAINTYDRQTMLDQRVAERKEAHAKRRESEPKLYIPEQDNPKPPAKPQDGDVVGTITLKEDKRLNQPGETANRDTYTDAKAGDYPIVHRKRLVSPGDALNEPKYKEWTEAQITGEQTYVGPQGSEKRGQGTHTIGNNGWSGIKHTGDVKMHDQGEASTSSKQPQGAIQTGPRGGRYIETGSGGKNYVGKSGPALYLDVEKANPNRDPSVGQFIAGGTSKAQSGEGQEDLSGFMESLMDTVPGEELNKDV